MELQVSYRVCAEIQNVRYTEDPEIGKIKTESDFQPLGTKSLSGFTGDIDTLLSDIVAHYYETERTPLYLQRINVQTK